MKAPFFILLSFLCLSFRCATVPFAPKPGFGGICAKVKAPRNHDFDLLVIAQLTGSAPYSKLIYASNYRRGDLFCFDNLEPGRYAIAYGDTTFRAYLFSIDLITASITVVDKNEIKNLGTISYRTRHSEPLGLGHNDSDSADEAQDFYRAIWQTIIQREEAVYIQPGYWLTTGDIQRPKLADEGQRTDPK